MSTEEKHHDENSYPDNHFGPRCAGVAARECGRCSARTGRVSAGGKITDYRHLIKSETILPVRYLETLEEAEMKDLNGFKTGLVYYGTCMQPSRIVRLKFKYADSFGKFFICRLTG